MGCSTYPSLIVNNKIDNIQNTSIKEEELGDYGPLGEKIEFCKPVREFNYITPNVLFLRDEKTILCDSEGNIHVYSDLNFYNPYIIKLFNGCTQDMILLNDGSVAACSDDKSLKIFKIGEYTHEIIKELKTNKKLWAIAKLSDTGNIAFGDNDGNLFLVFKSSNDYIPGKKISFHNTLILNIVSLSSNILMIIYMNFGLIFLDLSKYRMIGKINHKYFTPFKCSIQIISDNELLIGAENSIVLIDYINYIKIKEFDNSCSYSLYKLSDEYLLCNYGDGFLKSFKMIRDENGQLDLKVESLNKVQDGSITGMTLCPDGKFITFNLKSIKIWKKKNDNQLIVIDL